MPEVAQLEVLGAPVGHRDFIRRHFEKVLDQHKVLLAGIPRVPETERHGP